MIQIGDQTYALGDPMFIGGFVALALLACLFLLIFLALRAAGRSARATEPLAAHMGTLGEAVRNLDRGQEQLSGRMQAVTEAQVMTQAKLMQTVERRLEDVQKNMGDVLHGSTTRTARSLGELHTRLEAIDKAQSNIEKLSGDVLSLQDILSNKQTRGAFGEIQLNDIVSKALPADAYEFQATLSNGKRADCLIKLPNPPGSIVIDSKFPLEAYEALHAAQSDAEVQVARMPLAPDPEDCRPMELDNWPWIMQRRPLNSYPGAGQSMGWVKIIDEVPEDPRMHLCGVAFTSDSIQFNAARSIHPLQVPREKYQETFMGASLDHSMWFHRPIKADDWHLYQWDCHGLNSSRGMTVGNLFAPDGTHVATIAQEVLLRQRR